MTNSRNEAWLRSVLERISGQRANHIPLVADLEDAIGLDSLGRLEVLSEIEDKFDFFFDDQALTTARTIEGMLKEIDRHTAHEGKEPAE